MSTSWMKPAMFAAGAILLLTVGTSAWAGTPPICKTTGDPGVAEDCCDSTTPGDFVGNVALDCNDPDPQQLFEGNMLSEENMRLHPNIFVFLADDQGYCQYGFMQGYCEDDPDSSCQTRLDCPAGKECKREIPKDGDTFPLRLNEWSCRYRQRPSPDGDACPTKGTDVNEKKGDKGGPNAAFPFDSSAFPCKRTNTTTTIPGFPYNPGALTPHLDALAKEGAVFTRAHVSGNSCKPSRSSMTFGRHHRHSQWHNDYRLEMKGEGKDRKDWTPDPIGRVLQYASSELPAPYARFLLGKGEVVGVDDGGFNAGFESSGPRDGKFTCEDGDTDCENRVRQALDNNLVPHESRGLPGADPYEATSPPPDALKRIFSDDLLFTDDLVNDSQLEPAAPTSVIELEERVAGTAAKQVRPFFFWFAPRMPHMGGTYGSEFREAEFANHGDDQKQLGRVAEVDLALGAVVDELKRTCVCLKDANDQPTPHNLYENTVIIYLADHGLYMPKTKHTGHENNHRTPIIINRPEHRLTWPGHNCTSGECSGPVIEDQFAHSTDLVRTVVDLAGLDMPGENSTPPPPDPLNPPAEPLLPFQHGSAARDRYTGSLKAASLGTGSIQITVDGVDVDRPMQFGEWAAGKKKYFGADPSEARKVYVIPRPDYIGICNNQTEGPARPCISGADCPDPETGDPCNDCCIKTMGRCINNPTKTCDLTETGGDYPLNSQCVPSDACAQCAPRDDCPDEGNGGNRCKTNHTWSLGDFARPSETNNKVDPKSTACVTATDCIPKDDDLVLCRHPMLKIVSSGVRASNFDPALSDAVTEMRILAAYDLDVDPDQTFNLLNDKKSGDRNFLGTIATDGAQNDGTLGDAALDCLRNFWKLDPDGSWVDGQPWADPSLARSNDCSLLEAPPTQ